MNTRYLLVCCMLLLGYSSRAQPGKPLPVGYLLQRPARRLRTDKSQLKMRSQNNPNQIFASFGIWRSISTAKFAL